MSLALLTTMIREADDVALARRHAREVAELIGFGAQDQTRIATAVSEIARNALQYAGGGRVGFTLESHALCVVITDEGPGIERPEDALRRERRSAGGLGKGLPRARLLMDAVEIESAPGRGTRVRLAKQLPSGVEPPPPERIARAMTRQRPATPLEEMRAQNQDLLRTLDDLNRAQARLRLAMETANLGEWSFNPTTGRHDCSARTRELLGLPRRGEVDRAAFLRAVHPDDRAAVEGALRGAARREVEVVFRVCTAAEEVRWLGSRARPIVVRGARQLAGTLLDITAHKRREEEAAKRAEFARQLIGIVSHDLRTPLGAILNGAWVLARMEIEPRAARVAERIRSSGQRAARLVDDLLVFTRARLAGDLPIEPASTDLRALCRDVVEELQEARQERHILVEHEGDVTGVWDRDRLAQVISNLLGNALEHGAAEAPVSLRCVDHGDAVTLAVHNQGEPIPEEARQGLFEPMRRLRREGRGVGLGLYIVDRIVRAHGGEIEVDSSAGEGTTFTIRLPRLRERVAS